MSEELIVSHCSPTMAGLKTGNLFTCRVKDREELKASLRRMNLRLVPRGIRMVPVRYSDNKALIYMYRPDKLRRDLTDPLASSILAQRSYPTGSSERCVAELARRLNAAEEFPHEIGLFLGYPLGDVIGFIDNGGKNSRCPGCWKVYGNECEAMRTFARFDKCRAVYQKMWANGRSIVQLTVA